jgi:hypothetical protein
MTRLAQKITLEICLIIERNTEMKCEMKAMKEKCVIKNKYL